MLRFLAPVTTAKHPLPTFDRRVLPETILEFAQKLQSDKYPYQLTMYESAGHGLRGLEAEVNDQVASWLKKHSQIR